MAIRRDKNGKFAKKNSKVLTNYILLVLDRSGSMGSIRQSALNAFNEQLRILKERAVATGQRTYVDVITFANHYDQNHHAIDAELRKPLDRYDYQCQGGTALFDAVGEAVKSVNNIHDPNSSFVIMTITDGEENSSIYHSGDSIKRLIKEKHKDGRYTFVFNLPHGAKSGFCSKFDIPLENCTEWEATEEGTQKMSSQTSSALGNYYSARAAGKKSVKNFYADMSNVKTNEVKRKLDDISQNFKVYKVDKEQSIKEFVEEKTKKEYVIGSVYYQLTKTEKIQPQKQLLVMKKLETNVYGGAQARDLAGLPHAEEAKVTPVNLGDWELFCQSTSVNRKLVRGTKVLLDRTLVNSLAPTWA